MIKVLPLILAAAVCLAQPQAPVKAQVPDVFKVNFDTSKGMVVLEIHRDWAPIGADHLYELVQAKFYDGARFFRVVTDFVVQFGLNGKPDMNKTFINARVRDDVVKQRNVRGSVTYAMRGPNTRSTQLFINLKDNSSDLDSHGFAPIGRVVSGMNFVERLYSGYGEISGAGGSGPNPQLIETRGDEYLQKSFPRLDYIKTATIEQ